MLKSGRTRSLDIEEERNSSGLNRKTLSGLSLALLRARQAKAEASELKAESEKAEESDLSSKSISDTESGEAATTLHSDSPKALTIIYSGRARASSAIPIPTRERPADSLLVKLPHSFKDFERESRIAKAMAALHSQVEARKALGAAKAIAATEAVEGEEGSEILAGKGPGIGAPSGRKRPT